MKYLALACAVCFGKSNAPLMLGLKAGVLTLLGILLVVLGGFLWFMVRVARRSKIQ